MVSDNPSCSRKPGRSPPTPICVNLEIPFRWPLPFSLNPVGPSVDPLGFEGLANLFSKGPAGHSKHHTPLPFRLQGVISSSQILRDCLYSLRMCWISSTSPGHSSQSIQPLDTDNQKLIFSHCLNQTSSSPSHSPLLSELFQKFIVQSSKSSFFETIVGDEETAISGMFQCRNNLSLDECRSCVSKFQGLSHGLCGKTMPVRIQLSGCYVHYQEDGTDDYDSTPDQVLHRACSRRKVKKDGLEEMKYAALAALESGVISGNGFCEMNYESIHVVAQCAGSLGACDCGGCVSNAVQIVVDECRYSVSGEVYLDSCFISFDYYKNHGFGGYTFGGNGVGGGLTKLVAIVVGGIAAVLLGLALCYFITSCGKTKNDW